MTAAVSPQAPIGVFDSGVGGLTVVRRLREILPLERIVYVADQTHVPYGGRELSEVCGFACGISEALLAAGSKALVMACNISSATALPTVQAEHSGVPVVGTILPGAQAAVEQTRNGRIGVLATEGTVKSGAYTRVLQNLNASLRVTEVACPTFVPLVEAGRENTPAAEAAAGEYLAPLNAADVDVVVLGCTHYPFLLPVLQALSSSVLFIDPAEQVVRELAARLTAAHLLAPGEDPHAPVVPHLLTTTGNPAQFAALTCRFLPDAAQSAEIGVARWENGRLRLPE